MKNFKKVINTRNLTFESLDKPQIIFIIPSGSTGNYHVIIDEPGPMVKHLYLIKSEIENMFGKDITDWL